MQEIIRIKIGKEVNGKPFYVTLDEHNMIIHGMPGSGASNQCEYVFHELADLADKEIIQLIVLDFGGYQEARYWLKHREWTDHIDSSIISPESLYPGKEIVCAVERLAATVTARYELLQENNKKTIYEYNKTADEPLLPMVFMIAGAAKLFTSLTAKGKEKTITLINVIFKLQRCTGIHIVFDFYEGNSETIKEIVHMCTLRLCLRTTEENSLLLLNSDEASKIEQKCGIGYFYNTLENKCIKYYTGSVLNGVRGTSCPLQSLSFMPDSGATVQIESIR